MELTNQQRNVVIIGGGPAGIWADIWAAGTASFHTELRRMMSWDR